MVNPRTSALALTFAWLTGLAGCDGDDDDAHGGKATEEKPAAGRDPEPAATTYVLNSIVINPDNDRMMYVQTLSSLDDGPFDNTKAIEFSGNGVVMARGKYFFVGLIDEPTWVRYELDEQGSLTETGRLSLLDTGASSIDYGNVLVDDETAVSVFSKDARAVVWNPSTMEISGTVELGELARDGYEMEVWTTSAHDGLVYIPARWADWEDGRIYPNVTTIVLDPKEQKVLGIAEDDRCASGGRVVFGKDGHGYVMGDGRNYSIKMFAKAKGEEAPKDSCLLRLVKGEAKFDPDFYYSTPELSGGYDTISELDTAGDRAGIGFAKLFYPEKLPPGVEPIDFEFWDKPAHKLWQFQLGDEPTAKEVEGFPFATLGFNGSAADGKLYLATNPEGDSSRSDVYVVDPATNSAELKFSMAGYFNGLYALTR